MSIRSPDRPLPLSSVHSSGRLRPCRGGGGGGTAGTRPWPPLPSVCSEVEEDPLPGGGGGLTILNCTSSGVGSCMAALSDCCRSPLSNSSAPASCCQGAGGSLTGAGGGAGTGSRLSSLWASPLPASRIVAQPIVVSPSAIQRARKEPVACSSAGRSSKSTNSSACSFRSGSLPSLAAPGVSGVSQITLWCRLHGRSFSPLASTDTWPSASAPSKQDRTR